MTNKSQIEVENKLISIVKQDEQDYFSLTDMVRGEEGSDHIRNWMRNYFDQFVQPQVSAGRYKNISEVIRAGL
jgi:hypothetical protein